MAHLNHPSDHEFGDAVLHFHNFVAQIADEPDAMVDEDQNRQRRTSISSGRSWRTVLSILKRASAAS